MNLSKKRREISIVVPTLNEAENIELLVKRIDDSFRDSGVTYEVIFVDDHSVDDTCKNILALSKKYPITLYKKEGERGKAYSLLQGFEHSNYNVLCMIDADLQYPPEAILPMYSYIIDNGADLVITERKDHATSKLRQLSSKVFNFVFTRMLFGFNYDSQSGLKLFKRNVIDSLDLHPTPWSFDLEFIVRALEKDFKILNHQISFDQRQYGVAKVRLAQVTYELAKASIMLRVNSSSKKIKRGYRKNVEFSKLVAHDFSAILIALSFMAGLLSISHTTATAQSLVPPVLPQIAPLLNQTQPVPQPAPAIPPVMPQPIMLPSAPAQPQRAMNSAATPRQNQPSSPSSMQSTAAPTAVVQPLSVTPLTNQPAIAVTKDEATFPKYINFTDDRYKDPAASRNQTAIYTGLAVVVAGLLSVAAYTNQTVRAKISWLTRYRNA